MHKARKSAQSNDINSIIGRNLKLLRVSRGQSREKFAAQLGFSSHQLQKYETGVNRLRLDTCTDIARILGQSTESVTVFLMNKTIDSEKHTPFEINEEILPLINGFMQIEDAGTRANIKTILKKLMDYET